MISSLWCIYTDIGFLGHRVVLAFSVFESKIESNSTKRRHKTWVPFLNISVLEMEVLAEVVEASKLSLFVGDLLLHREHPKDAAIKLLELVNNFDKVKNCKINIQDSEAYLHTSLSEKIGKKPFISTKTLIQEEI